MRNNGGLGESSLSEDREECQTSGCGLEVEWVILNKREDEKEATRLILGSGA